jgi:hypothetical protein
MMTAKDTAYEMAVVHEGLAQAVRKMEEKDAEIERLKEQIARAYNEGVSESAAQFRACRHFCGFEFSGKRWLDWTNSEIESLKRPVVEAQKAGK